ncbi:Uncharacterized conserved protein [Delftia tsuruhatensis]|uniref:DcrB-related protein n=1 Tax=Delftia tsuruhatensis TaxID=180282 RepID=UPI001E734853|nr:DUF1795 domain-containing protein [Delftia tsuruhatensis]CAB5723514.1 Uncharacterized conserved protein [Delftia tsuruhatensis]CAC9693301.1 Uncharacterized conserved protein [Delftia tsuruhatensis]
MKYTCNEASFELPDELIDRSVHMLMSPDGTGVSYVITRDRLLEGEALEGFVSRQLKDLSRQSSKFREISRSPAQWGQRAPHAMGLQIETSFRQQGRDVFQRQAVVQLPDTPRVLILTANAFKPFTEHELAQWHKALASCVLA